MTYHSALKSTLWLTIAAVSSYVALGSRPAQAQTSDYWKSAAIIGGATAAGAYIGHKIAGTPGTLIGAGVGGSVGYAIDARRRRNAAYNDAYAYGDPSGYYGGADPNAPYGNQYPNGGYNGPYSPAGYPGPYGGAQYPNGGYGPYGPPNGGPYGSPYPGPYGFQRSTARSRSTARPSSAQLFMSHQR